MGASQLWNDESNCAYPHGPTIYTLRMDDPTRSSHSKLYMAYVQSSRDRTEETGEIAATRVTGPWGRHASVQIIADMNPLILSFCLSREGSGKGGVSSSRLATRTNPSITPERKSSALDGADRYPLHSATPVAPHSQSEGMYFEELNPRPPTSAADRDRQDLARRLGSPRWTMYGFATAVQPPVCFCSRRNRNSADLSSEIYSRCPRRAAGKIGS